MEEKPHKLIFSSKKIYDAMVVAKGKEWKRNHLKGDSEVKPAEIFIRRSNVRNGSIVRQDAAYQISEKASSFGPSQTPPTLATILGLSAKLLS